MNSEHEVAFLMNIVPMSTPIELRIVDIKVGEDGARVRVTCRAGLSAEALAKVEASAEAGSVDMSKINGVLIVATGDDIASLAPKTIPAANVTYDNGAAVIAVPASAGRFIKARIDIAVPAESL